MDILPLLDELQTIACNGLNFATGPYDRERYARLLELASTYYGQALDLPTPEVRRRLRAELGYITPKVGAEAAIFDRDGAMLLVRRSDDGRGVCPAAAEPNDRLPRRRYGRRRRRDFVQPPGSWTCSPAGQGSGLTAPSPSCIVSSTGRSGAHEVTEVCYRRIADVSEWHGGTASTPRRRTRLAGGGGVVGRAENWEAMYAARMVRLSLRRSWNSSA
jgi:hypothetical protein